MACTHDGSSCYDAENESWESRIHMHIVKSISLMVTAALFAIVIVPLPPHKMNNLGKLNQI